MLMLLKLLSFQRLNIHLIKIIIEIVQIKNSSLNIIKEEFDESCLQ